MVVLTTLFSGTDAEYGVAMNCGAMSLLSNTVMVTVTVSVKAGEPSKTNQNFRMNEKKSGKL